MKWEIIQLEMTIASQIIFPWKLQKIHDFSIFCQIEARICNLRDRFQKNSYIALKVQWHVPCTIKAFDSDVLDFWFFCSLPLVMTPYTLKFSWKIKYLGILLWFLDSLLWKAYYIKFSWLLDKYLSQKSNSKEAIG